MACRQAKDKRDLVRLVRTSDGTVEVDVTGRKPGRGAYLCTAPECWETGLKRGQLARALRAAISGDNQEQLAEQGKAIVQGVE